VAIPYGRNAASAMAPCRSGGIESHISCRATCRPKSNYIDARRSGRIVTWWTADQRLRQNVNDGRATKLFDVSTLKSLSDRRQKTNGIELCDRWAGSFPTSSLSHRRRSRHHRHVESLR